MKLTAALVLASALAASPALAQQRPAADNAPGSQTQEMQGETQGRVGTSAGPKAVDKPESRGTSGDQHPTTTGAGGSPSPSHTTRPPETERDAPRDGATK
jgi:hypothetical protein